MNANGDIKQGLARMTAARSINAMQDLVVNEFHWHNFSLSPASAANDVARAVFDLRETLKPGEREAFDAVFQKQLATHIQLD